MIDGEMIVLKNMLRVSFTVCVWESYTEIFSGQRKSQKMARNSAQGEKQHSGASTASTSASAAIRVRSRPDPFLVICRCFSIVTSAAAILCISVNILSAIHSFKDGSDIFDGIFRCYAVVIAMFVVVAETEWGFIKKFWKVLDFQKYGTTNYNRGGIALRRAMAGSIIPTASLAGTEVSVDEIRSATTSSDRYYPPSLHAPLISSPEPDPNGANNLIPMEIALKIAEKIKARERFVAYIVIPMWPEGNPTSAATQKILFWQNKTMQMMYETIYKALVEVGLQNEYTPQDYLNLRSYLESTGEPAERPHRLTASTLIVEYICTFLFAFAGVGSAMWACFSGHGSCTGGCGDDIGGFRISGGHLNPAVTLGLCVGGHITVFRSILYWIDQLLAFATARALLKYLTGGLTTPVHTLASGMDYSQGVIMGIILTFSLLFSVYALCVDPKKGFLDGLGPLLVGLVVGGQHHGRWAFLRCFHEPTKVFWASLGEWKLD
ncbi:unnamed protein product [Camellia sinensis]